MMKRHGESIEVRAKRHLYPSVIDVERRVEEFRREPRDVQIVALALLDRRIASNGPGFLSAAFAPSIALVGAIVTVVVSLSIAEYNNLSAALLKLTDPATGKVHGISSVELKASLAIITQPLAWVAFVIAVLVAILLMVTRDADNRRASATAWVRIFEAQPVPAHGSSGESVWRRIWAQRRARRFEIRR
jgi:hypothetical protein